MAFGVRLHLEQILLHRANTEFQQYEDKKIKLRASIESDGPLETIDLLKEECLVHKSVFVISASIAIESFLNFSLRKKAELEGANAATQDRNFENKLKNSNYKWKDKLVDILGKDKALQLYNEIELKRIQNLRNDLVHYKYGVYYQGFGFGESEIEKVLSDQFVMKMNSGVQRLLSEITEKIQIPEDERGFLSGEYKFFFYDG